MLPPGYFWIVSEKHFQAQEVDVKKLREQAVDFPKCFESFFTFHAKDEVKSCHEADFEDFPLSFEVLVDRQEQNQQRNQSDDKSPHFACLRLRVRFYTDSCEGFRTFYSLLSIVGGVKCPLKLLKDARDRKRCRFCFQTKYFSVIYFSFAVDFLWRDFPLKSESFNKSLKIFQNLLSECAKIE